MSHAVLNVVVFFLLPPLPESHISLYKKAKAKSTTEKLVLETKSICSIISTRGKVSYLKKSIACRDGVENKDENKVEMKTQRKTNLIQKDGGEER